MLPFVLSLIRLWALTNSPLRAYIIIGFLKVFFADFEYFFLDELSYNFSRFYGFKQSFFHIKEAEIMY